MSLHGTVEVEVLTSQVVETDYNDTSVDVTALVSEVAVVSTIEEIELVEVITGIKGDKGDQGDQGTPGLGFSTSTFSAVITVASTITGSHTYTHGLGFYPAGVQFFDGAGRNCELQIDALDTVNITINPFVAWSGRIVLS